MLSFSVMTDGEIKLKGKTQKNACKSHASFYKPDGEIIKILN